MAKPPVSESPKSYVSPSSAYLLYGHGTRDAYELEVRRVKTELRKELYGPSEEEQKKKRTSQAARPNKKKKNVAAIMLLILAVASVLVIAAFAVLTATNTVDLGETYLSVRAFFERLGDLQIDVAFGRGVCALLAVLFLLTTLLGAACSTKRLRIGYLMLTGTVCWTAATIASAVLSFVEKSALPIEGIILTVLALLALVVNAVGAKKKGGK